jgi:hypothetical protein
VTDSPAVENHAGVPVAIPAELSITFERTECLGTCPVYVVGIRADRTVYWRGLKNVSVLGDAHKLLEGNGLDQLAVAFDAARFFERQTDGRLPPPPCDDHHGTTICVRGFSVCSDTSHFIITASRAGKSNKVDDAGCYGAELEDLRRLERLLEQIAGTAAWIGR